MKIEIGAIPIILGLVMVFLPYTGLVEASNVFAFIVSIIGIGIIAYTFLAKKKIYSYFIGGLILILGIILFIYPNIYMSVIALIVYLIALLIAIYAIYHYSQYKNKNLCIIGIVVAVIYFLCGFIINNPGILSSLTGIGLILIGLLNLIGNIGSK